MPGRRWTAWGCLAAALAAWALAGCRGAQAYYDRGDEQFREQRYDEAIADYRRALALEPTSAEGWNRLGTAYREKYNTERLSDWKDKEIAAFERSVRADSVYWPARINLGASLFYLGRKAEAAPHLKRALELNPDNPQRPQIETMIAEGEEEAILLEASR
jgi:tetratricopeptide (TPR) repeat protein